MRAVAAALVLFLVGSAVALSAPVPDKEGPPLWPFKLETARWMVHTFDWAVLSTLSTRAPTEGFPFGNPYSFADGTVDASTGIPYFYTSDLDASMVDIFNGGNSQVSLTLSENQYGGLSSCEIDQGGDPENPPCARLVLSGEFKNITGTDEAAVAQEALFSRHPAMEDWPSDHSWFFAKVDISSIWFIDIYGGADQIDVEDYFATDAPTESPRETLKKKIAARQH